MSIVAKRVIGRNNQHCGDLKKDISSCLGSLREFVTTVTQAKKSARGFKSTCEQIESFLADANKSFAVVDRKVFGENGVNETAEQVDYTDEQDVRDGNPKSKLCRATKSLHKYLSHFNKLLRDESVARAALNINKYKPDLLRIIDKAKDYNNKFAVALKTHLNSAAFAAAIMEPDSCIAISEGDLTGTKAEKRKFLDDLAARMAADEDSNSNNNNNNNNSSESSLKEVREENFVVEANGVAHPIPDEADGVDAIPTANNDGVVREESFGESSEDDDEDSSDDDSDDDSDASSDDDAASTSNGEALFEGNLARINQKTLKEVQKNAFVRGGRMLRNNGRLDAYAQIVSHNKDLQVDEYRQTKHSSASAAAASAANEDEIERDYGSELSASDDEGNNEIEAVVQKIKAERQKALAVQKSHATSATTVAVKIKRERETTSDDNEPLPVKKIKKEEKTGGAKTNEVSQIKIKKEPVDERVAIGVAIKDERTSDNDTPPLLVAKYIKTEHEVRPAISDD
jgi:hypothetical protein